MLICCGHCQPRLLWTDQNMSEPQEICFLSVGPSRSCACASPGWRLLTPSTDRGPCVHCWSALHTNHHMTNIQPWRLLLRFLFSPRILLFSFSLNFLLYIFITLSFLLMYNLISTHSSRLIRLKCTVDFLLPEPYPSHQKPHTNSYFPLSSPGPASGNH